MEAACTVECAWVWRPVAMSVFASKTGDTLGRNGFRAGPVLGVSRPARCNRRHARKSSAVVATDADGFDELAVPLDLLLTRPVFGLADRIAPNLSWHRF